MVYIQSLLFLQDTLSTFRFISHLFKDPSLCSPLVFLYKVIIKNVFEDDKVFESSAIDLRSIFQLLQLHEIASADLENA